MQRDVSALQKKEQSCRVASEVHTSAQILQDFRVKLGFAYYIKGAMLLVLQFYSQHDSKNKNKHLQILYIKYYSSAYKTAALIRFSAKMNPTLNIFGA